MFEISFYIESIDDYISGFEMGGIELFFENKIISSKNNSLISQ